MQAYLKESWKTDSEGPNQGEADVRCCPVRASLLTVITNALFFSGRGEKNEKKHCIFQYFRHHHHRNHFYRTRVRSLGMLVTNSLTNSLTPV